MANTPNRELRLKMVLEADAKQGSGALKALAADAEKIDKHLGQAAKSARDVAQGGKGGSGSAGGGGSGSSGGSGGSTAATILGGAAVATAASGLLGFANAIGKIRDESATAREKLKAAAEAVPILGGALSSMLSDVTELAQQFRDKTEDKSLTKRIAQFPVALARQDAGMSYGNRRDALLRQGRSLGFAADAAGEFPTLASQRPGDNRDPRLATAEESAQAARRALAIAQKEQAAAVSDEKTAITARDRFSMVSTDATDGKAAARRFEEARASKERNARFDEERSRFERLDANGFRRGLRGAGYLGDQVVSWGRRRLGLSDSGALQRNAESFIAVGAKADDEPLSRLRATAAVLEAEKKVAEAQNLAKNATEATTRLQERSADLARKKYELAKAETDIQKARLSILDDQEKKLQDQASLARQAVEQFGMYDPTKQDATVTALQRFKSQGRNGLSGEQLDLLSGTDLTRNFVKGQLGNDASNSDAYKKLLAMTGQQNTQQLDAELKRISAEKLAVKTQVDLQVQLDEKALQDAFRTQFQDLLTKALRNIAAEENIKVTQAQIRQGTASLQRNQ